MAAVISRESLEGGSKGEIKRNIIRGERESVESVGGERGLERVRKMG